MISDDSAGRQYREWRQQSGRSHDEQDNREREQTLAEERVEVGVVTRAEW